LEAARVRSSSQDLLSFLVGGFAMIARTWRGITRESDKDTYYEYLQKTGLPDYAHVPGNRGVWVLRKVAEGKAEFLLISLWDSYDAIKKFAGTDYEKAVYYPEDTKFLLELEPHVTHYEILGAPAK
jgi:heme-degrading monooxygenase HmoA